MINVNAVYKSYRGKLGCMCGCMGSYKVASRHVELAGRRVGYAYDLEDVSDRAIKGAVNKLNRLIDWTDREQVDEHVREDHAYAIDDRGNQVVVYFVGDHE
jgi:hypothetical protein